MASKLIYSATGTNHLEVEQLVEKGRWKGERETLLYKKYQVLLNFSRSSRSEVFLKKGVLKICSKFTGEHPSVI